MGISTESKLQLQQSFKNAEVYTVDGQPTAVVKATGNYITIDEFKNIFNFIGSVVVDHSITKLIFDKTALNVFHQPSMEWYFVEWKEKMFDLGLKTHRKILPQDEVFKQSVKIGRDQINSKYPDGKFHQMDIQYFDTIDEAIKK